MKRFAALALAALALAPLPALAGEARASGNVPVRTGPGSGYPIIGNLVNRHYYEVEDCTRQARWCLVSHDGDLLGWVRGSYLVGSGAKAAVTPFEFTEIPFFTKKP